VLRTRNISVVWSSLSDDLLIPTYVWRCCAPRSVVPADATVVANSPTQPHAALMSARLPSASVAFRRSSADLIRWRRNGFGAQPTSALEERQ
jgi:hypothetical protein